MFVIFCYDVGSDRVKKVMKTAKKYLFRVQDSVFEGSLTEAQLNRLKKELSRIVDPEHDSLVFYGMDSPRIIHKSVLGTFRDAGRFRVVIPDEADPTGK